MSKFGKRIVLIHKLRKLRGSEKFLNGGDDGTNVDKVLRSDDFRILSSHAFANDALHAAHANTELVL